MTRSDEMMLSAIRLKVEMQMNGRDVTVEEDAPPEPSPAIIPDAHVHALCL